MSDELLHYGMPRRSGRYPWGSGDTPYQRAVNYRSHIQSLRDQGMKDVDIAKLEGVSTTQLRARMSLANAEKRMGDRTEALRYHDKGMSNMEIGRRMGINESSVRSLLDPVLAERASITAITAQRLKESVDAQRYIDIGSGVENHIGVNRTKLNNAVAELVEQGYKVHKVNVDQVGMPGKFTTLKVLGAPDTEWKEVVKDPSLVKTVVGYSDDYGRTYRTDLGLKPVENISADRVMVRFAEDGGADKDGVMELRRGVPDLDMGGSHYAQVRIGVNGTHFLKGMAIYNDELPPGVDIIFNTNKSKNVPVLGPKDNSVLKPMKNNPDNPFGATIKENGQRGALNIVNEEGDWAKWSKTISSQILSKQPVPLAKQQLDLALKEKQEEYDSIMSLTNPVVKKQLLLAFGDGCDSDAVHLKAAALPRQASKVLLPIPNLKETEVYAPTFNNGEVVVLIRHPHGGRFEIPQLIVNNKDKGAKAIMGNAIDAIGINPVVAKKLSGADFDGDAVIVIPNNSGAIKNAASLKALENFDPIEAYRLPKDSPIKPIKPRTKQKKMGEVSNLITDMTIKGANLDELARAVKHSMVVIDSEKHNLDYRQSYIDNGIAALSAKYQKGKQGGASTLISRASSDYRVPARVERKAADGGPIDPVTGKKAYTYTNDFYTVVKYRDPLTGKVKQTSPSNAKKQGYAVISTKDIKKTTLSTRMAETNDARTLSSGRPIEEVYASYANTLKNLGNTARKNALALIPKPYNPSAKVVYQREVDELNASLNIARKNKPVERQAQIQANSVIARAKQANPGMDADEIKKLKNQSLTAARLRTGAKKHSIEITDRQWEAIQAGAVSPSKLSQILENTNLDRVKQLATPRTATTMTESRVARAKAMLNTGYNHAEIAEALGVSTTTIYNALK